MVRPAGRPGGDRPRPRHRSAGCGRRRTGVYVVVGVEERDPHGGTIYNTTLYLGPEGDLLGKHRKLMPTGSERTVWGMGDGSTLPVIDTPFGRLSGLTCWENYMPLVRFTSTPRGSTSGPRPPSRPATAGWPPCGTSPVRVVATWSGSTPACTSTRYPPGSRSVTASGTGRGNGEWVEPGNSVIVDPRRHRGRPGAPRGGDPDRRGRSRRGSRRPSVLRPDGSLLPAGHLPPDGGRASATRGHHRRTGCRTGNTGRRRLTPLLIGCRQCSPADRDGRSPAR